MDIELTPGEQLRIWRKRRKLTLEGAAELFDCAAGTVANVELARHAPSLEMAVTIERHTSIPASAWVKKQPDPNPQETTT